MAYTPPVVVEPVHGCARAVRVAGAADGAEVRVEVDGEPAGEATADAAGAATVELDEALTVGATVTAVQVTGDDPSGPSAAVQARPAPSPQPPRVLGPVVYGVSELALSGVTPGSHVTVHRRGERVSGEAHVTEPLVRVPVRTIQSPIRVTAELCGETTDTGWIEALPNPSHSGDYSWQIEFERFGTFAPPSLDELNLSHISARVDLSETPLRGRLFRPLPQRGRDDTAPIRDRPLVIVCHGYHSEDWDWWHDPDDDSGTSQAGYTWLGEHLASWGMFVCSIDASALNEYANTAPGFGPEHYAAWQRLRGEVILEMLDRLLAELEPRGVVSRERIGLVGHSVGGEAVVIARELERRLRVGWLVRPMDIRGVVAIAPESHTEHTATHTAYLQLHSPDDYVMGEAAKTLYEPAWRPRTHAWIDGAGHYAWNTVWLDDRDNDGQIEPGQQKSIGRRLITAFFLDTLLDQPGYRGLLTGHVPPPRHPEVDVRFQHASPAAIVIDDFGDGSHQLGLQPTEPAVGGTNRLGGATGASGFDRADVADLAELAFTAHRTRALDLSWTDRGGVYETELAGLDVDLETTLMLRLTQPHGDSPGTPGADLDLVAELSDGTTTAKVRLGAAAAVGYPFEGISRTALLRTVRLPLDAFVAVEPALDVSALERLRLRADLSPAGRVLCGSVEFDTMLVAGPSTVRMLRVHQLGDGYGPAEDHLDTEAVVALDDHPDEAFGLTLRPGPGLAASQAALHILRSAITTGGRVRLVYSPQGPSTRRIVRVEGQHDTPGVPLRPRAQTQERAHPRREE